MRFLLSSALLLVVASCVWAPPPPAEPAVPAAAVAVVPAPLFPLPFAWLFGSPPGRLTLSNYSFDNPRVQTLVTGYTDCVPRAGTAASEFVLPLNGTRVIDTAPGADVCWRRAVDTANTPGPPPSEPGWSEWNRAFTSSGRPVDSRL